MTAYRVSVFLALSGVYFLMAHGPSNWNDTPPETLNTVIFKVLPMISLLMMVYYTNPKDSEHLRHRNHVLIGLSFSMAGDIALVWKNDFFIPGLLLFAIAHVFYILSFRFRPLGLWTGVLSMLAASVLFMFFLPQIKTKLMKFLVAMYIYMIFTMFWRSHVRWQMDPRWDSLCASLGAILFIISDFILAFCKWYYVIYLGSVLNMVTYYLAQFGLALSVAIYPSGSLDIRHKKRG